MLVKVICISSSCEPGRMKRFFRKKQTFEMENKNKTFQSSSICVCIYLVICLPTYFIFVVPEVCIPNAELFFRLPAKGGTFFYLLPQRSVSSIFCARRVNAGAPLESPQQPEASRNSVRIGG